MTRPRVFHKTEIHSTSATKWHWVCKCSSSTAPGTFTSGVKAHVDARRHERTGK